MGLMLLLCGSGCHQGGVARLPLDSPVPESPEVIEADPEMSWVALKPGLRISREAGSVMFEAEICLDEGWLEQLVCGQGTREHESIMVTTIPASSIHAAMLAVGLEAGRPGQWVDGFVSPKGSEVMIRVRVSPERSDVPLREWVIGAEGVSPDQSWVFAGSRMRGPDEVPEGYSRYEADTTGSIIGLVTFGDEMLAYQEVIPDQIEVAPEEWKARTEAIPPVGTKVWVLVSPVPD